MKNPKVSILIPCYNAESWLTETLESALSQTWTNTEIIVVDDGSTDNSLAIAKQFESSDVKVITQSNQGATKARNYAYQEAQGDFIQYLDADDLLASDKIEKQLRILENNQDYIASGEWARFYKIPSEALFIQEPIWDNFSPVNWLICSWEGGGMMHPGAWLVPRPIAEKAGPWNTNLSFCPDDDGEYFCRVVLASQGVKFCEGAKSYYRSGNLNSLSNAKSLQAQKSVFLALEIKTEKLLERENNHRTRHACATAYQRFIYSVYPDVPELVQKAEVKVQQLGGSNLKPGGGIMFKSLSYLVGWKQAKSVQKLVYKLRSSSFKIERDET